MKYVAFLLNGATVDCTYSGPKLELERSVYPQSPEQAESAYKALQKAMEPDQKALAITRKHETAAYCSDAIAVWSAATHGERAFPLPELAKAQPAPIAAYAGRPCNLTAGEIAALEWLKNHSPSKTSSRLRALFRGFEQAA